MTSKMIILLCLLALVTGTSFKMPNNTTPMPKHKQSKIYHPIMKKEQHLMALDNEIDCQESQKAELVLKMVAK